MNQTELQETEQNTSLLLRYADEQKRPAGMVYYAVLALSAHAKCLRINNVISEAEETGILHCLTRHAKDAQTGTFLPEGDLYDAIFHALKNSLGNAAGRLETALSRPDFYHLTGRIFVKNAVLEICQGYRVLIQSLISIAQEGMKAYFPGYADGKVVTSINAGQYFLSVAERFLRDIERLENTYRTADVMPLWSGYGGGISIPLPREKAAELLGFSSIAQNAYDSVSDVDYLTDFIYALSAAFGHLSQIAIDWKKLEEKRLIALSKNLSVREYPQASTPIALNEVCFRAKKAQSVLSLALSLIADLPLGSNRITNNLLYQADSLKTDLMETISLLSLLLQDLSLDGNDIRYFDGYAQCGGMEIADYLAQRGALYTDALDSAKRICSYAEENNLTLERVPLSVYKKESALFGEDVLERVKPRSVMEEKEGIGSSNRAAVRENIRSITKRMQKLFR
ncbi:MAG: hypothetical protein IIY09_00215 [Clostridia bacterium]|nr:hypothetical protein [Clostridia bacterium]